MVCGFARRVWLRSAVRARECVFAGSLGILLLQSAAGLAQTIPKTDSVPYAALYMDELDVTHFRNESLALRSSSDSRPLWITDHQDATDIGFVRIAAGAALDWHPAPRKQFVMVLKGVMAVEAGDGETRRFEAGHVLLVTDTAGRGHKTGVIGEEDVVLVWVQVP